MNKGGVFGESETFNICLKIVDGWGGGGGYLYKFPVKSSTEPHTQSLVA